MNAEILYQKIVELEGIKPKYRKSKGVSIDSLCLLYGTTAPVITNFAIELEAHGKVKLLYSKGRSRNPLGPSGAVIQLIGTSGLHLDSLSE